MISTRDLSQLPDVDGLRRTLQSMAMLDAILCPEWQYRYYSFNAAWAPGEQMGSMRNGSGDEFFAHFSRAGCWLKGFAHEMPFNSCAMSSVLPVILGAVPQEFASSLNEPAFSVQETTFCIWRRYVDRTWQMSAIEFPADHPDPDGSGDLLSPLDGEPETYQAWAAEYYGRPVDLAVVDHVYRQAPLTSDLVTRLNRDVTLADLAEEIREIGYPAN